MAELNLYEVPHRNGSMLVKLSEEEAELVYGDLAKKVRPCQPATVQEVPTPPWAADPEDAAGDEEAGEKKSPAPANKARSARNKA